MFFALPGLVWKDLLLLFPMKPHQLFSPQLVAVLMRLVWFTGLSGSQRRMLHFHLFVQTAQEEKDNNHFIFAQFLSNFDHS